MVVVSSDYLVSVHLQLLLLCYWGRGCCWAVTSELEFNQLKAKLSILLNSIWLWHQTTANSDCCDITVKYFENLYVHFAVGHAC